MIEILTLLGGAGFRVMFGGILDYFNKRQDHKYELERMEKQAEIEVRMAEIRAQAASAEADARLKQIGAEWGGKVELQDAASFGAAFEAASKPTGMKIPDFLNAMVRPTITLALLAFYIYVRAGAEEVKWEEADTVLFYSVVGFWFADRSLRKMSGK